MDLVPLTVLFYYRHSTMAHLLSLMYASPLSRYCATALIDSFSIQINYWWIMEYSITFVLIASLGVIFSSVQFVRALYCTPYQDVFALFAECLECETVPLTRAMQARGTLGATANSPKRERSQQFLATVAIWYKVPGTLGQRGTVCRLQVDHVRRACNAISLSDTIASTKSLNWHAVPSAAGFDGFKATCLLYISY